MGVGRRLPVGGIEEEVAAGYAEAPPDDPEAAVHLEVEAFARDEDEGNLGNHAGLENAVAPFAAAAPALRLTRDSSNIG
jgi:hypothetical protein